MIRIGKSSDLSHKSIVFIPLGRAGKSILILAFPCSDTWNLRLKSVPSISIAFHSRLSVGEMIYKSECPPEKHP